MNTSLLMRIIVSTLGIEANLRRSELDGTIIVPAPKPTGGLTRLMSEDDETSFLWQRLIAQLCQAAF